MRADRTGTGTVIGRSGWDDGLSESINMEHAAQNGRFRIKNGGKRDGKKGSVSDTCRDAYNGFQRGVGLGEGRRQGSKTGMGRMKPWMHVDPSGGAGRFF